MGGIIYFHQYALSAAQLASAIGLYDLTRDGAPPTTLSPARARLQPNVVLLQVKGGTVRFSLAGTTPTASVGFELADGASYQDVVSPSEIKVIASSGTPILTVALGQRGY